MTRLACRTEAVTPPNNPINPTVVAPVPPARYRERSNHSMQRMRELSTGNISPIVCGLDRDCV